MKLKISGSFIIDSKILDEIKEVEETGPYTNRIYKEKEIICYIVTVPESNIIPFKKEVTDEQN